MLRVIVESATNIPKTKFGKPDPIVSVIFKGKENCRKCTQGGGFSEGECSIFQKLRKRFTEVTSDVTLVQPF